jgi:hypothetical protein
MGKPSVLTTLVDQAEHILFKLGDCGKSNHGKILSGSLVAIY